MLFYVEFALYREVLEFLDNAKTIYGSIGQAYSDSISIIEFTHNKNEYLIYRVYITLHELPEDRLHKDKRK